MFKGWIAAGLAASLLYGVSAIFFRLLSSDEYLNGRPGLVLAGIGVGIALCGVSGLLFFSNGGSSVATSKVFWWAVPAGFVNGAATILILRAMQSPATNVSQLVPLYNTNTLVAFILAVLFMKELPESKDLLINLVGAVLIVAGTVLLGYK